jgi:hypothetical protein
MAKKTPKKLIKKAKPQAEEIQRAHARAAARDE